MSGNDGDRGGGVDGEKKRSPVDLSLAAGTFGARRLPELKSLWREMSLTCMDRWVSQGRHQRTVVWQGLASKSGSSGKRKASLARHLRRRPSSHSPRKRHRYPTGKEQHDNDENNNNDDDGACRRKRRRRCTMERTHTQIWQETANDNFEENESDDDDNEQGEAEEDTGDKELSRCKPSTKCWLSTHLWHAKRFHMGTTTPAPRSGDSWAVPLAHAGRGTLCCLRHLLSGNKATLQDATWTTAGRWLSTIFTSQEALQQWFQAVASPEDAQRIVQRLGHDDDKTACFWDSLVLHHANAFPARPWGPVSVLLLRVKTSTAVGVHVMLPDPCLWKPVFRLLQHDLSIQEEGEDREEEADRNNTTTANERKKKKKKNLSVAAPSSRPIGLLRLRGGNATAAIAALWDSASQHAVFSNTATMLAVPHGTVLRGRLAFQNTPKDSLSPDDDSEETPPSCPLLVFRDCDDQDEPTVHLSYNDDNSGVYFLRHCPKRALDELTTSTTTPPPPTAVGWDIVCAARYTKHVFQAFDRHTKCLLAVGLAEEAAAQTEALVPVWPRDYPDTPAGQAYYNKHHQQQESHDYYCTMTLRSCQDLALTQGGRCPQIVQCQRRYTSWAARDRNKNDQKNQQQEQESPEQQHRQAKRKEEQQKSTKGSNENEEEDNTHKAQMETKDDADNNNNDAEGKHKGMWIDWEKVASPRGENQSSDSSSSSTLAPSPAVVVRGSFVVPFVNVLRSAAPTSLLFSTTPDNDTLSQGGRRPRRRRPRRRVLNPKRVIRTTTTTTATDAASAHHQMCDTLLSSLSFRALIRCHVVMEGSGTVKGGDVIFPHLLSTTNEKEAEEEEEERGNSAAAAEGQKEEERGHASMCTKLSYMLGYVTAGCFSPSRGECHGVGFIGAARFLQLWTQSRCHLPQVGVKEKRLVLSVWIVANENGNEKIKTTKMPRLATLTLLP